ncbi:MAG: hypothetical protein ACRDSN_18670 [Pseudonocardiaceae bacterium]
MAYIDKQLDAETPKLEKWTVAVVGGEQAPVNIGGLDVGTVIRSRLNDDNPNRADIKTQMSKQDRVLDLDVTSAEARADSEQNLADLRQEDPVHRDRGLLALYPIDAHSAPVRPPDPKNPRLDRVALDAADTVIGIGLVFPGEPDTNNRIKARHMAVSLADVNTEDLDEILNTDTEDDET